MLREIVLTFYKHLDDDGVEQETTPCTLRSASNHLNADYRNAVIIDKYRYWSVICEADMWAAGDARIREKAPDGTVTTHDSASAALRRWTL